MKPRTFATRLRLALLLLLGASLPLATTLRTSPIALVLLMGGNSSSADRDAQQIALRTLCAATREGDRLLVTAVGPDVDLPTPAPESSNFLEVRRLPEEDMNVAIADTARHLTTYASRSKTTLCVVLASPSSGAIRAESVGLLPPSAHIRLIGPTADANLAAFNAASASPVDLSQTPPARLPEATTELIHEMQGIRTYQPTSATLLLSGAYVLSCIGFLARRRYLRRRKLHLLWEADGRDEAVELMEGQETTVAGQTLRRENGRIVLSNPNETGTTGVWKQPGDTLKITPTDEETVFVHIV